MKCFLSFSFNTTGTVYNKKDQNSSAFQYSMGESQIICLKYMLTTLLSKLILLFTRSEASLTNKLKKSSTDSGCLSVLKYKPKAKTDFD